MKSLQKIRKKNQRMTINQSSNSDISSPEPSFNLLGIAQDEINNRLQDDTISEDQLSSRELKITEPAVSRQDHQIQEE